MLRPFVAYLRVYEPLVAFGDPPDPALLEAVDAARLDNASAGQREQQMWLKSQIASPARLLPAELVDGRAAPSTRTDVLVLDPADVTDAGPDAGPDAAPDARPDAGPDVEPGAPDDAEGAAAPGTATDATTVPEDAAPDRTGATGVDGPLICPLELRARSAAALVSFLGDAHPALRSAVLDAGGASDETVRSRATAALADLHTSAIHVLSTTWTVPLPWFALVDPDDRKLVLGSGRYDPARELSWRVPIGLARERAVEARRLVADTFGEEGAGQILAETINWLDNFHPDSVVELDYGGLVQLIADPILATDTSAEEVHRMVDALRSGATDELADLFGDLRDYWADLAARERYN